MSIDLMLRRALPGSNRAVREHIRRGEQIATAIAERWGVNHPHRWKMKHVRWYCQIATADLSTATRYDHWRTPPCPACGHGPAARLGATASRAVVLPDRQERAWTCRPAAQAPAAGK